MELPDDKKARKLAAPGLGQDDGESRDQLVLLGLRGNSHSRRYDGPALGCPAAFRHSHGSLRLVDPCHTLGRSSRKLHPGHLLSGLRWLLSGCRAADHTHTVGEMGACSGERPIQ